MVIVFFFRSKSLSTSCIEITGVRTKATLECVDFALCKCTAWRRSLKLLITKVHFKHIISQCRQWSSLLSWRTSGLEKNRREMHKGVSGVDSKCQFSTIWVGRRVSWGRDTARVFIQKLYHGTHRLTQAVENWHGWPSQTNSICAICT